MKLEDWQSAWLLQTLRVKVSTFLFVLVLPFVNQIIILGDMEGTAGKHHRDSASKFVRHCSVKIHIHI